MEQLLLPRVDEEGKSYISYSQIKSWNAAKGFNTGALGKYEYMYSYFFGERWPDMGWAEFGQDVEDFICYHKAPNVLEMDEERKAKGEKLLTDVFASFDAKEKGIMKKIKPLGTFQKEIKIDFGGFYLLGYIDDATADFSHLRDYKTCSKNSSQQYYEDDYYQLDLYALWVLQETGKLPKKLEVCMIERAGNCFRGGGRGALSVKGEIWYHERKTGQDRLEYLEGYIRDTAQDISKHYKAFLSLTGGKQAA